MSNPIEKLQKLGEAAGIPYTESQLLDVGLTVIRNTRDFERALGDWELLPTANKTWGHFKTHFENAQKQLKAIRGPTIQQAGYHRANHLAFKLRQDMESNNNEILSLIQEAMEYQSTTLSQRTSNISDITPPIYPCWLSL